MKATTYNTDGTKKGTIELPKEVFQVAWNGDLVHQVVVAMEGNARTPIAHTKDRSEVSGTGKKPWKQKGTGNARHGSRRSPIWRTGGVAHGPRNERDYSRKINKKMRTKALYAVLSKKLKDGEVLFVDTLSFDAPRTQDAKQLLTTLATIDGFAPLATKRRNAALIAIPELNVAAVKSFRNFGNVTTELVRNLNPRDLLQYKYLVFTAPEAAIMALRARGQAHQESVSTA